MSPTFQSLSIRNYRLWFIGGMVSNIGTWAGRVGQDWLVLTELTPHSATALGIVTGLECLPILLLAPWAGAMADRFDKRTILILTQAGLLLTTLVLGLLAITGTAVLWHVYVIATLQGILTAVDNPTRQAFVPELVGREHLPNAVGLNSASFNLGRLVGPGLAGVVIAVWGTGQALLLKWCPSSSSWEPRRCCGEPTCGPRPASPVAEASGPAWPMSTDGATSS